MQCIRDGRLGRCLLVPGSCIPRYLTVVNSREDEAEDRLAGCERLAGLVKSM